MLRRDIHEKLAHTPQQDRQVGVIPLPDQQIGLCKNSIPERLSASTQKISLMWNFEEVPGKALSRVGSAHQGTFDGTRATSLRFLVNAAEEYLVPTWNASESAQDAHWIP